MLVTRHPMQDSINITMHTITHKVWAGPVEHRFDTNNTTTCKMKTRGQTQQQDEEQQGEDWDNFEFDINELHADLNSINTTFDLQELEAIGMIEEEKDRKVEKLNPN